MAGGGRQCSGQTCYLWWGHGRGGGQLTQVLDAAAVDSEPLLEPWDGNLPWGKDAFSQGMEGLAASVAAASRHLKGLLDVTRDIRTARCACRPLIGSAPSIHHSPVITTQHLVGTLQQSCWRHGISCRLGNPAMPPFSCQALPNQKLWKQTSSAIVAPWPDAMTQAVLRISVPINNIIRKSKTQSSTYIDISTHKIGLPTGQEKRTHSLIGCYCSL